MLFDVISRKDVKLIFLVQSRHDIQGRKCYERVKLRSLFAIYIYRRGRDVKFTVYCFRYCTPFHCDQRRGCLLKKRKKKTGTKSNIDCITVDSHKIDCLISP